MYFDSHAHYTDEAFDADRDALLTRLHLDGVELIMNVGNDEATSLASMELAERFPFVYASVGWHPHDAKTYGADSAERIRRWCENDRVRAVGEIGLDYYYDLSERSVQLDVFRRQMALAERLGLPVVVHDREAHADCMKIVREYPRVRGVFHCYSGSAEMAAELLKMGWYLGFTGSVTFKNARKSVETLEITPMDRILIETDCPYLAPVPHRGERNDSGNLVYVAERIAEIKGVTAKEIAGITMENAKRLYEI